MEYKFASRRQVSFIISAGGRNLLVSFGARNQAGVSVFMTSNPKVAQAIRRHSLTRRGIIEETTPPEQAEATVVMTQKARAPKADETTMEKPLEPGTTTDAAPTVGEATERIYDNYTVARESICKEFDIKKGSVRNPEALAHVAKEHGIIIKYKEI